MAFVNPLITAYAVEATEFPDLARRYHVSGVPKTVKLNLLEARPYPSGNVMLRYARTK